MENPIKALKEAIDYLQTPERLKDNIEIVGKLIDAQQSMLDIQEKELDLRKKVAKLERTIDELKDIEKFIFAPGRKYLIDPEEPTRALCPVCTIKNKAAVPMYNKIHCTNCKNNF